MILKIAKNIDEYLSVIRQIKSEIPILWFRGQSNSKYMLEPSLYRDKGIISGTSTEAITMKITKGKFILKDDITALHKFKEHFDSIHDCNNFGFIDYLYVMQHYGIPTRLLDFTSDELVALYFAVSKDNDIKAKNTEEEIQDFYESESYTDNGAAVFCIDPIKTNGKSSFLNEKIVNLNAYEFESLGNIDTPVCIETENPDKRIIAQKGVFVFFGYFVNPYDYYDVYNKTTYKIFIPNSCRKQILFELKTKYSISHSTIYPDIQGIAMEIIDDINEKFKNDCTKWAE
ncbi:MAG: FRG domain-containing protein [Bacteroidota bacterium]